MVPQAEGQALIETLEGNGPEQGALVPMNCKKDSGIDDKNQQCYAAIQADRDLVNGLVLVRVEERLDCRSSEAGRCFHETSERIRSHVHTTVTPPKDMRVSGNTRRPIFDR